MNPIKIPRYQLYLLQLENYELGRFWKLLFKKGLWPKGEQRKSLVWTAKAAAIFIFSDILIFVSAGVLAWIVNNSVLENKIAAAAVFVGLLFLFKILSSVFFSIAVMLLWPLDWLIKEIVVARAKGRVKNISSLKIIGIAGSYGKTTMKQVLLEVLGAKFNIAATPESVNTPVGIARWVLKKFDGNLEIAIVEMGEHYQGDIKYLCDILSPDIAVVTGINEAHLERMKNMETVTDTIFEIVDSSKSGSLIVLNGDDENIINNYKKYSWPDMRVAQYQVSPLRQGFGGQARIKNQVFDSDKLGWHFEVEEIGQMFVNLLGEYALGDLSAAITIAKSLGMDNEEIKKGIKNIKPVEHRLQPIKSAGNILVIDDSYNGNPHGAAEAIKVLSRFTNRRKVYITPGLVETGKAAPDIHREIGRQLAGAADVVILIRNSAAPFIEQGVKSQESIVKKKPSIIWFETAQEAHAALPTILKPNDVALFQNDWGDQYI